MPGETRSSRQADSRGMLSRLAVCFTSGVAVAALRLLYLSWRKDTAQLARIDRLLAQKVPVIAAFWHDSYVPLFVLCQGRQVTVLVGSGYRGAVIAGICRAFGYHPVQVDGPGKDTVRTVLKTVLTHQSVIVAVAIDGPLGPRHHPKPGILHLAGDLGYRVVPVFVTARPRLVLAHRWDRMQIPLPFAKVKVHTGEAIVIPPNPSDSALSAAQQAVTDAHGCQTSPQTDQSTAADDRAGRDLLSSTHKTVRLAPLAPVPPSRSISRLVGEVESASGQTIN